MPDESEKPVFLSESAVSAHPHYVIVQNATEGRFGDTCASWGHVRDWWSYRGWKWMPGKQIDPQKDANHEAWVDHTSWMWPLRSSLHESS